MWCGALACNASPRRPQTDDPTAGASPGFTVNGSLLHQTSSGSLEFPLLLLINFLILSLKYKVEIPVAKGTFGELTIGSHDTM